MNSSRAGSHSITEAPFARSSRATCRASHRASLSPWGSACASSGSTCRTRTRLERIERAFSEISRPMAVMNRSNPAVSSPGRA